jgi:hypothetical protein
MTDLLEKALSRVASLPAKEQDFVASIIMQELDSGERWDTLFADARSQALLERLGREALAEHEAGRTSEGGFGGE